MKKDTTIYKVNSNVRHDNVDFLKGEFITVDDIGAGEAFDSLLANHIISEVSGAKNVKEAQEIIDEEARLKAEEEAAAQVFPADTWGAKKDEDEDDNDDDDFTPPQSTGNAPVTDEDDKKDEDEDGADL